MSSASVCAGLLRSVEGARNAYVLDRKGNVVEFASAGGGDEVKAAAAARGANVTGLLSCVQGILDNAQMKDQGLRRVTIRAGGRSLRVTVDQACVYVVETAPDAAGSGGDGEGAESDVARATSSGANAKGVATLTSQGSATERVT